MKSLSARRVTHAIAATTLLACSAWPGLAQDPRALDFDHLPDPMECFYIMMVTTEISERRDKGVTKRQIEDWAKIPQKFTFPQEVIDGIYAFPKLRPLDHSAYWSWRCRARANGLPFASLKSVESKLQACPDKGKTRHVCLQRVRNQLLGLPLDYVPPSDAPTIGIQDVRPTPPPAAPAQK